MIPTWQQAWTEALYGPQGFYRVAAPVDHFTTAAHGPRGALLAAALWRHAADLGVRRVVDFAAGRGELAEHLVATAPTGRTAARPAATVAAIDLVDRPVDLTEAIDWWRVEAADGLPASVGAACADGPTLVVAHEWLDVVPCPIAEVSAQGELFELRADLSRGDPLGPADQEWVARWWPSAAPGARLEVGRVRDEAWAELTDACPRGTTVLAIDYGHVRERRPVGLTVTGFRRGQQVEPALDGSCDVTAHVAVDSLRQHRRRRQRDALAALGVTGRRPDRDRARVDPFGYLQALADAGAAELLTRPGAFGDFWWVEARAG